MCLLKVDDSVKEKSIQKFKEIKSKSEDSGSKARQYLDGLLKIPFNIYKREPILNIMSEIKLKYIDFLRINNIPKGELKENSTSLEILKTLNNINLSENNKIDYLKTITTKLENMSCNNLKLLVSNINELIIDNKLNCKKLKQTNRNMKERIYDILDFINYIKNDNELNKKILKDCFDITLNNSISLNANPALLKEIEQKYGKINTYMNNVKLTLDKAVHGHDKAKKQIERIIGQWINGKQDGYCFGFEGPPGIGKTTMAKKGLADCLIDENGISRPFAMIQMGGDANGSSLHGHNYTYVGSTWGSIVQILIDKKCMNPIIFIDEVDKISKTEHGKEIVGILTHLLDPAQNDCFQDKYFSGIDLDLSKALFILSYNDVESIDKIMLDRIHRVKFKNLTLDEKLVISNVHILPEVYDKMGLQGIITISDDVLKFLIDEYTSESGVRKLKEILFEIIGEINLDVLKNNDKDHNFPIIITVTDIKTKYFKDKREIIIRKVPDESLVGYANGMYATSLGNGGTLPIHAKFFPSEQFLELKLTGLQQDVMKESMHVSLTVAWNLTSEDKKQKIRKLYDGENNKYGINIHPGDGSVQKDGPSAGGIITLVLYSLLNDLPIKARFAMTGEIQMSGHVTAIGGLNHKILGSLKAGVKEFIYPKENKKDFDDFYEKYKDDERLKDIKFYEVDHISEALELIIEK